eukprot:TRINITY_DN15_c0_g1_i7.p3 TRINITY_DN15_c0_g1~~TRINITY_DN15_c0_g1_i7.p3  ORF type:complete len:131 (+),score=8.93 TRINITY_DN15_c0_g1_i7:225-617(+)
MAAQGIPLPAAQAASGGPSTSKNPGAGTLVASGAGPVTIGATAGRGGNGGAAPLADGGAGGAAGSIAITNNGGTFIPGTATSVGIGGAGGRGGNAGTGRQLRRRCGRYGQATFRSPTQRRGGCCLLAPAR